MNYYLFIKKYAFLGQNDRGNSSSENSFLLATSDSKKEIELTRSQYQYDWYKNLESHYVLNEEEIDSIIDFFGDGTTQYNWSDKMLNISMEDYKQLYEILKVDFFNIESYSTKQEKYYPLFNHSKLSEIGLNSFSLDDLDFFTEYLFSTTKEEAFEKGVLALISLNEIPPFMGDPETNSDVGEFLEMYEESHKNLLEYFDNEVEQSLISKHGILKFWLLLNPYLSYSEEYWKEFFNYKSKMLGDKELHFDKLVKLFKTKDLIQLIEI